MPEFEPPLSHSLARRARRHAAALLLVLVPLGSGCFSGSNVRTAQRPNPSPNLITHARLEVPFRLELHGVPAGAVCAKGLEEAGGWTGMQVGICIDQFRGGMSDGLTELLGRMMPRASDASGMVAHLTLVDFGAQLADGQRAVKLSLRYQFWLSDPTGRMWAELAELTTGGESYAYGVNLDRVINVLLNGVLERIGQTVDQRLMGITAEQRAELVTQWQAQKTQLAAAPVPAAAVPAAAAPAAARPTENSARTENPCQQYVQKQPSLPKSFLDVYGPDGSCWRKDQELAQNCRAVCASLLK